MLNLTEAQLVNKQVEKCYLQFLEIVLPLLSSLGFTMYFAHLALARFFFFFSSILPCVQMVLLTGRQAKQI